MQLIWADVAEFANSINKNNNLQNQMDYHKTRQKLCADMVKGTHLHLRQQLRKADGDYVSVWKEHCQNHELLSQYAEAMRILATDIWTQRPDTRIDWCYDVCVEYFQRGGLLKLREKEQRRLSYERSRLHKRETLEQTKELIADSDVQPFAGSLPEHCTSSENSVDSFPSFQQHCSLSRVHDFSDVVDSEIPLLQNRLCQNGCIDLPFEGKITLLDVGSCHNSFEKFDNFFSVVGIDLYPAVESVLRCDFLQLQVTQKADSSLPPHNISEFLTSPVTILPEASFHVVVFSLLLEYLPSPHQRWTCCRKAHQLLMLDGLLLIVSPDSHHQQRNAPMMSSWKVAIEAMGFTRWRYVKQEHLHCMAFRKSKAHSVAEEKYSDMLYIPQDSYAKSGEEGEDLETCHDLSSGNENEQSLEFMHQLNDINYD